MKNTQTQSIIINLLINVLFYGLIYWLFGKVVMLWMLAIHIIAVLIQIITLAFIWKKVFGLKIRIPFTKKFV